MLAFSVGICIFLEVERHSGKLATTKCKSFRCDNFECLVLFIPALPCPDGLLSSSELRLALLAKREKLISLNDL